MPYHDDLQAARARIEALESELRRLKSCQSKWHFQPHPDVKECPDCGGTNYWRPEPEKPGFWRRLFGRRGPVIRAGGDINISTNGSGEIKGLRGYLPSRPPPPRPIPPAYPAPPKGGSGVQASVDSLALAKLELLETKLDRVLNRLQILEAQTRKLEECDGRMAAGR